MKYHLLGEFVPNPPGKWKYLLCSAKLYSELFHSTDHIPPYINRLVDLRYQVLPVELNSFQAQSWHVLSPPSIFSFLAEGLYKCCPLYLEDVLFYLVNSQISFSAKVTSSMKPPLTLP